MEDLVQETFLRVFRALPYYDGRARLSTWIYTIAHRVAIDHLRRVRRRVEDPFTDDDAVHDRGPASDSLDPEGILAQEESVQLIRESLAGLPDKYRLPLVYAAIEGLDYATIAAMLGIPVGTAKTLIFRAKQRLRDDVAARLAGRKDRAPHAV
jgi:RNA polymerase sigma-70 factor (ECF subfamily)